MADERARAGSAAGQLSALRAEHSQLLAAFAEHDAGTSPLQIRRAQRACLGFMFYNLVVKGVRAG